MSCGEMSHLEEENLSYWVHMGRAFGFSSTCFRASLKAFIHGVFPNFFQDSSSGILAWFKRENYLD